MNKVIVVVDDEIDKMEQMLLYLQAMLIVAAKAKEKNAPNGIDTKICVLHVKKENSDETKEFEDIKTWLKENEQKAKSELQDASINFELQYEYVPVQIDAENYPQNSEECTNLIRNQIDKICEGKESSIILDVVLVNNKDQRVIKNQRVLSQELYNIYANRCILYTGYHDGEEEVKFRNRWKRGVEECPEFMPVDRTCLNPKALHLLFRKRLYNQLRIGDEIT